MNIDLTSSEVLDVETLTDGNALGSTFSASTASTASCPASSAASLTTWSTLGG